jgi:hypothetical protein
VPYSKLGTRFLPDHSALRASLQYPITECFRPRRLAPQARLRDDHESDKQQRADEYRDRKDIAVSNWPKPVVTNLVGTTSNLPCPTQGPDQISRAPSSLNGPHRTNTHTPPMQCRPQDGGLTGGGFSGFQAHPHSSDVSELHRTNDSLIHCDHPDPSGSFGHLCPPDEHSGQDASPFWKTRLWALVAVGVLVNFSIVNGSGTDESRTLKSSQSINGHYLVHVLFHDCNPRYVRILVLSGSASINPTALLQTTTTL